MARSLKKGPYVDQSVAKKIAGKNSPTLLFVTHHVEEIVPAITHALLLRDGRTVSAGTKSKTLTTKNLTRTFAAPLRLHVRANRYTLQIL